MRKSSRSRHDILSNYREVRRNSSYIPQVIYEEESEPMAHIRGSLSGYSMAEIGRQRMHGSRDDSPHIGEYSLSPTRLLTVPTRQGSVQVTPSLPSNIEYLGPSGGPPTAPIDDYAPRYSAPSDLHPMDLPFRDSALHSRHRASYGGTPIEFRTSPISSDEHCHRRLRATCSSSPTDPPPVEHSLSPRQHPSRHRVASFSEQSPKNRYRNDAEDRNSVDLLYHASRPRVSSYAGMRSERAQAFARVGRSFDSQEDNFGDWPIPPTEGTRRPKSTEPDNSRKLVERLENMQRRAVGGQGDSHCSLCGNSFGFWGPRGVAARCYDCSLFACQKHCGVETVTSTGHVVFLCKLCSEKRELWKKTGAWFYRGLPKYDIPELGPQHHPPPVGTGGSPSSPRRLLPSPPIHATASRTSSSRPKWSEELRNKGRHAPRKNSGTSSEDDRRDGAKRHVITCRNNRFQSDSEDEPPTDSPLSSRHDSIATSPTASSQDQPIVGPPIHEPTTDTSDTRSIDSGLARSERSQSASAASDAHPFATTAGATNRPPSGQQAAPALTIASSGRSYSPVVESPRPTPQPSTPVSPLPPPDKNAIVNKTASMAISKGDPARNDSPEGRLSSSPDDESSSLGTLEFSMLYDESTQTLRVKVVRAQKLRAMDSNGFSDPYVKVHLIPGAVKSTKLRTKTIAKTLNPEWNEDLVYYGISEDDMLKKTLRLTVFDEDKIGSDFLGETRVNLKRITSGHERHFNVYLDKQLPVEQNEEALAERGKILLSLLYVPSKQQLVVGVVRCAELLGMDSSGYSDPYVKLHFKPDKKLKFKTPVKKKTCNPEFGSEFAMPLPHTDVDKKELEVTVFDKDVGKHDDFIGGIVLSANARGECLRHWNDTIKNAGRKVERWHKLQELQLEH